MSEFIPWSQLVAQGVVGVDAGEKVKVVRARLRKLGGHGQYNAPILVRLADGSIAPTSAAMLRRLAQERGAGILEERLDGLLDALCPRPWVAEGQEAAQQEAQRRRLPVLVAEEGQITGLMLPPGRLALIVVRDKELFDLFDEPLDRDELARTEFVQVAPNATVAKVAQDLKQLRQPRTAHIIVGMDDGAFRAMPASELNEEVKRLGAGAWSSPFRQFYPRWRSAASAAFEAVGRAQAQAIADERSYLVLTDGEGIGGLVSSQLIRRRAESHGPLPYHGVVEPLAYDLFTVPQAVLDRFAFEAESEERGRFVNLWFEDADRRTVEAAQPLVFGATYNLALNVGRLQECSIVDWEKRLPSLPPDTGAVPIVMPKEEWPRLYASVFSQDFEAGQPTQILTLPPAGNSEPVLFEVQPLRRTFGDGDLATLDVCLYYRCSLVQSFQVKVEVRAVGEKARTPKPQWAELKAARLEDYPDLDQITPKQLSLTVTKRPDGAYQFTFTLDPEAVQDPRWEAIRFGCHVKLRREDLTHLITKARRQLYNIARSPDYQGSLTGTPAAHRQAMRALATVGRQLYLQLFRPRDKKSAGAIVAQWIQEGNLKRDSRIQIVDRAGDFVFPWALIYDQSPWGDGEIEPQGFWGIRYELELLTEGLVGRYGEIKPVIETDELSVGVGLYDYLPGARQQRTFFEKLAEGGGSQVKAELFNSTLPLRRALQSADQHILYFFCHGFTERMAADIQIGDDLLAEFKALFRMRAEEQRAGLEKGDLTHYDALFDVSDSWLQLTRGTVPLTMMEDTLLDAGARFRNGPLVFLNMCESAQVLPSLSGGFIPFFLDYGARGVVGTECPMTSTFADPFAQAFLQRFLQGQPVGRILLDLRREFLGRGNPLGLAYTLYCDADVRLASGIPAPHLVHA